MERLFVPYELAVAMKELGFDEECFGMYENNGVTKKITLIIRYDSDPIIPKENAMRPMMYKTTNKNSEIPQWATSAPLYQQAFKWFKNVHGLVFMPEISPNAYSYEIWDEKNDKEHESTDNMEWLKRGFEGTYEEVELHCLRKLIEITKENGE